MIYFFYLKRSVLQIEREILKKEIEKFSYWIKKDISKYKREADQEIRILGKLLLKYGLAYLGFDSDSLIQNLTTDLNGKPFIPQLKLYFNLSHAGDYIICAITTKSQIGVDIEKIKTINFEDLSAILREDERLEINKVPHCNKAFYRLWTQKEASLKADGRGLLYPIECVTISNNTALIDTKTWYLKELFLAKNYICHLAIDCDKALDNVLQIQISNSADLLLQQ